MEMTLGLIILVIGLGITFFQNKPTVQQLFVSLASIGLLTILMTGFATDASLNMVHFTLLGMLGLSLIVPFVPLKGSSFFGILIALVALVPVGAKVSYFDFEIHWSLMVALLPLFGALVPLMSAFKAKLLKRWFAVDEHQMMIAIGGFFMALLTFFSIFEASFFGPFLVAAGWLLSAVVSREKVWLNGAVALLTFSFVLFVFKSVDFLDESLLRGNFLMGLIGGTAVVLWNKAFKAAPIYNLLLGTLTPIFVLLMLVSFGVANSNFGGLPTFVGAMLGLSLVLGVSTDSIEKGARTFLAIPFIFIGLTAPVVSFFTPEKLETETLLAPEPEPTAGKPEVKKDVLEVEEVVLDNSFKGDWKSIAANSKLEFELGPEGGKTQGAFKEFSTTITMDQDGKPTKLAVIMNANKLTTFNPERDESVLGEDYVNASKFSKITYTSTSIVQKGDSYQVTGNLEFLGVKESIPVTLKLAAKGDKNGAPYFVFVGKSQMDRTKHGMASDPKIGDLVDITFEIAVAKK